MNVAVKGHESLPYTDLRVMMAMLFDCFVTSISCIVLYNIAYIFMFSCIFQVKAKEVELQQSEHDLRVAKSKNHELELASSALHNDNTSLRKRLQLREEELSESFRSIDCAQFVH